MNVATRNDGMMSALGRLGRPSLPGATTIDPYELYAASNLAAAIIDRPAEDALAGGVDIEGDNDSAIEFEMDRLRAVSVMTEALRLALLSGCACVLPLCDDSPDLMQPLALDRIRRITGLRVFGQPSISRAGGLTVSDPASVAYGEPVFYSLRPANGAMSFNVHHTRMIRVPGEPVAMRVASLNLPWQGRSTLDGCANELRDYAETRRLILRVLERKQSPVLEMAGLGDLLANHPQGESVVATRLAMLDTMRGMLNTTAVDATDKFTIQDMSVSGLAEVDAAARIAVSAAARIPSSVLFGQVSGGLASTGEGDLQTYHARVNQIRARCLRAALEQLVEMIVAQRGMPPSGNWRIKFPPLWSPSEKENAEVEKLEAEAEAIRVATLSSLQTLGAISPEETRARVSAIMPEMEMMDAPSFDDGDGEED